MQMASEHVSFLVSKSGKAIYVYNCTELMYVLYINFKVYYM